MFNVARFRRGVRRLIAGKGTDLAGLARAERRLSQDETATMPPAIFLDGELDRIKALSPWRAWKGEKELIDGGRGTHSGTIAYDVGPTQLIGAWIYAGAGKVLAGDGKERWFLSGSHKRYVADRARLVTSWTGRQYFGHLLLDEFPLALIEDHEHPCILCRGKDYPHEDPYRHLFGLPIGPVVELASIGELTIYRDFGQNSFKEARYRELRTRLRAAVKGSPPAPGVYLRRGTLGEPRVLSNQNLVEDALQSRGFRIIEPESMTAAEIAAAILDAPVVVGVEGSQFSHAIYAAGENATFVVLQPPDRFAMAYKEFTDRMEMRYAFTVGRLDSSGFHVDVDDLHRLLDRVGSLVS